MAQLEVVNQQGQKSRPSFVQSLETQAAVRCLREAKIGEIVTYQRLAEQVGFDVRKNRGPVISARRYLEREDNMVFACVRGEGYKRLADKEIVDTGPEILRRTRRATRRAQQRLACVAFDQLSEPDKSRHQAYQSLFGAIRALSKPKAVETLEGRVAETARVLPLNQTLEAFKK